VLEDETFTSWIFKAGDAAPGDLEDTVREGSGAAMEDPGDGAPLVAFPVRLSGTFDIT
jgi:hypothetical protein